jgi:hypothetical protein
MDPSKKQVPHDVTKPLDALDVSNPLADQPVACKIILLSLFCFAQFLDTFSASALYSAMPVIATTVGLNNSEYVWLNSAYQLTFAAFLLIVSHFMSPSG